jgi:hypothetical protein
VPPPITGLFVGSTAYALCRGQRALSTSPSAVMCPPVPTPVMVTSIPSGKSRSTSSAVVRRCTSMFDPFSNCIGSHAPSGRASPPALRSSTSACARAMAPFIPTSRGVSSSRAPNAAITRRRSTENDSGMHSTSS